jgi:hypothetical protein
MELSQTIGSLTGSIRERRRDAGAFWYGEDKKTTKFVNLKMQAIEKERDTSHIFVILKRKGYVKLEPLEK